MARPLARAPRYLATTFFKLVQNMVLLKEEPWCSHNQCGWMWAGRQPGGANISEEKAPVRALYQASVFSVLPAIGAQSRGTLLAHYKWGGCLKTPRVAAGSLVPAGASMSEGGSHWQASGRHQSATVGQGAITPQRASGHCLSAPRQVFLCSQTQFC